MRKGEKRRKEIENQPREGQGGGGSRFGVSDLRWMYGRMDGWTLIELI